jgi:hypothetical protein
MPTKPALASKGVWGGIAATAAGLFSFIHTVNLVGFAQAIVDNWPGVLAALGGVIAAYGRIRASVFIAPPPGTIASSTRMFPIAVLASGALALQLLTGCGTLGKITPDETRSFTSIAVSNGLQFGIHDAAQRSAVAKQMVGAVDIYTTYSAGSVPTVEQFQGLLNKYLPAGTTKAITVSNLTALYTLRYSAFKDYKLPDQVTYLNSFLLGVKDGAGPFVVTASIWTAPQTQSLTLAREDMRRSLDKGDVRRVRTPDQPGTDKGDVRRVRTHDGEGFIFLILRALGLTNS